MKKRLALVLAAASAMGTIGMFAAHADQVGTPVGTLTVNEGGYVVVADGDAANPDPADGFISVSAAGQVCADDNGTADDGNAGNGAESDSPTCAP